MQEAMGGHPDGSRTGWGVRDGGEGQTAVRPPADAGPSLFPYNLPAPPLPPGTPGLVTITPPPGPGLPVMPAWPVAPRPNRCWSRRGLPASLAYGRPPARDRRLPT